MFTNDVDNFAFGCLYSWLLQLNNRNVISPHLYYVNNNYNLLPLSVSICISTT